MEVERGQGGVEKKKKRKRRKNRSCNRGNFNKCTERKGGSVNRERGKGVREENAAALMMGDMQPLLPNSPSTDDMAQTPMCQ